MALHLGFRDLNVIRWLCMLLVMVAASIGQNNSAHGQIRQEARDKYVRRLLVVRAVWGTAHHI